MQTVEKKKVLKTKQGKLSGKLMPNSRFFVVEDENTRKNTSVEQIAPEDIKAARNPAYQYLA